MNATTIRMLTPYLLGAVFLCLASVWRHFILDDSFITYRYAENFVWFGEMTWNIGHDPVEGFTSFAWMLVNAAGISLGLSAVLTSQAVSVGVALIMIALLCRVMRDVPVLLVIALVAALALSPVFALHATQGMETVFASFTYFVTVWSLLRFFETPTYRWGALWVGAAALSFVTRPEAAIFQLPIFVVSLILLSGGVTARRVLIRCAIPAIIFCVAYTGFRYWYFGHLFPNTFYIKGAADGLRMSGLSYVAGFFFDVLAPYLVIWLALVAFALRHARGLLRPQCAVLAGIIALNLYLLTILPIQGYLHRFAIPLLPSMILITAWIARDLQLGEKIPDLSRAMKGAICALLVLVSLWPLRSWNDVSYETSIRSQDDRVMIGRALSGLDGRMFVTEAGALPYYSGWISTDHMGLNDELIAHDGLSLDHLDAFGPDLMMALFREPVDWSIYPVMMAHMAKNGFEPIMVNYKTNYPMAQVSQQQVHIYFLDPQAETSPEIINQITGIESITYLDLAPYQASFHDAVRERSD